VCSASAFGQTKPTITRIDYYRDVKPILSARCYACHGNGTKLGGFQIDLREGFLKGGQTHPVIHIGKSSDSFLIKLVSGGIPGRIMPARGRRLTAAEIGILKAWIDQGLSFGKSSVAAWVAPLAPRHPTLPPARPGIPNPIDRLLRAYFTVHRPSSIVTIVDDRVFARRAYLDLIGLLPTPAEIHEFVTDKRPDKRAKLAQKLLTDNQNYAEHWLTVWNDMLRNDYAGTGYIDGGRKQITSWLYNALATNMPYDRFVTELVNPTRESEGFTRGIVWRGVVNASQTPEMQCAQNIGQVFMGVNLKCASCHNSFINNWKLADAYGLAGIYADKPLEMVRCDKPTGQLAAVKFIYSDLGEIDPAAPRAKRLEQLAEVITSKKNGRLARTIVNRIWAKLMGRGLVEPADEMDNRPWNPDLLDWLASDFADRGYDMRRLMLTIVTSKAYQMPAMALKSERAEGFVFSGPAVKRMSAEQFDDAVSSLTGVWQQSASRIQIARGMVSLPNGRSAIKFTSGVMKSGSVDIDVDVTGAQALCLVVTDGGDGVDFDWADWADPRLVGPDGEIKLTSIPWRSASTGYGTVQIGKSVVEKPILLGEKTYTDGIGTHANSIITYLLPKGVTRFRCTAGPDANGIASPVSKTSVNLFVVTGDRSLVEARAALAVADPLLRALGRPNREQVVTQRATVATTLQALELTNGSTLSSSLKQGAKKWAAESGSPSGIVSRLIESALSRPPTLAELQTALNLLDPRVTPEALEDLLWAVTMLPEFQLVY